MATPLSIPSGLSAQDQLALAKAYNQGMTGQTNSNLAGVTPAGSYATTKVNSDIFNPPPTTDYYQPQYPLLGASPILSADTPQVQMTDWQKSLQSMYQSVADLNTQDAEKAAYTTEQKNLQGIPDINNLITDATTNYNNWVRQQSSLQEDARNIPLQTELNMGAGGTMVGLNALSGSQLRENSIRQGIALSKQNEFASQIETLKGNLASAQQRVTDAVEAKFGPIEAKRDAAIKNLELLSKSPQASVDEKNAANKQLQIQRQQQAQEQQDKQNMSDVLTYTNNALALSQNFTPTAQYPTLAAAKMAMDKAKTGMEVLSIAASVGLTGAKKDILADEYKRLQIRELQQKIDLADIPPDVSAGITGDPNSKSILSQTGLSIQAFAYLTQGTTALTRMTAAERKRYMNEAQNYANKAGIDISTFRARYAALNKTVEANSLRNNQASVAESELDATLQNLKSASDEATFGSMRWANIAKLFAGKEFNDPAVSKYSFHLNQLREEFAMYNAALAGQIDANGNIRDRNEGDYKRAEQIIKDGFAAGSIDGFVNALTASRSKMQTVLEQSISSQNKEVWKLFGVGDRYQGGSNGVMRSPDGTQEVNISDLTPEQIKEAKDAGWQ